MSSSSTDPLTATLRDLISANHILHHHGVVDAYGHVSIRHPSDPSLYIMCGFLAPALVSSPADLIHYHVSDSSSVDPNAGRGYAERFIHGELYKRFTGVQCVIHSHAEEVLPYVVTGVKLRPVYHMAGFLGGGSDGLGGVKVFDIDPLYRHGEQRDMLVNNSRFGAALAEMFTNNNNNSSNNDSSTRDEAKNCKEQEQEPDHGTSRPNTEIPDESVVLMRRHGFTVVGRDVVTAVYRAIYTRINAEAQTKAMAIAKHVPVSVSVSVPGSVSSSEEATHGTAHGTGTAQVEQLDFAFQGLTPEQTKDCAVMNEGYQQKPWRLWVREVERLPLYENTLS